MKTNSKVFFYYIKKQKDWVTKNGLSKINNKYIYD